MANPMLAKNNGSIKYRCTSAQYSWKVCTNVGLLSSFCSPSSRVRTTKGPSGCLLGR